MGCFGSDRSANRINFLIELLDDTELNVSLKGRCRGQILLDEVCQHLNLYEKDYFGLRYLDKTKTSHWVDMQKSLLRQITRHEPLNCGPTIRLYFGVKFYASDPCKVKEEITRYQFFLQLKRDVLNCRIPLPYDTLIELGALVVQSENGDYDPKIHLPGYVSEHRLVAQQSEEFEQAVATAHQKLAGYHPSACEFMYLDKIKWNEMYGVDLHLVKGAGDADYYIGLTPSGVVVYRQNTKVSMYYWPRIIGIKFKKTKFSLKVKDKEGSQAVYYFSFETAEACKSLWKSCIEHHTFFRLNQADSLENSIINNFFQLGSKFRYSGRTEKELSIQEAPRSPPQVKRTQSQKQERRAKPESPSDNLLSSLIQSQSQHKLNIPVITSETVSHTPRSDTVYKATRPTHLSTPDITRLSQKGTVIGADCLYYNHYSGSNSNNVSTPVLAQSWGSHRGLFTSGRDSPKSVRSDKLKFPTKPGRNDSGSEADSIYQRRRHKRESDNDSERSAARRRRRRRRTGQESSSDADSIHMHHRSSTHGLTNHQTYQQAYQQRQSQYSESVREGSVCSALSTPRSDNVLTNYRPKRRSNSRLGSQHQQHHRQQVSGRSCSHQSDSGFTTAQSTPDSSRVQISSPDEPSVKLSHSIRYSLDTSKTPQKNCNSTLSPSKRRASGSYENIAYGPSGFAHFTDEAPPELPPKQYKIKGYNISKNHTNSDTSSASRLLNEVRQVTAEMTTLTSQHNGGYSCKSRGNNSNKSVISYSPGCKQPVTAVKSSQIASSQTLNVGSPIYGCIGSSRVNSFLRNGVCNHSTTLSPLRVSDI